MRCIITLYVSIEEWGEDFKAICDVSSAEEVLVCQDVFADPSRPDDELVTSNFYVESALDISNGDVIWHRSRKSEQEIVHRTIAMSQMVFIYL